MSLFTLAALALAPQGCSSDEGGCDSPVPALNVQIHAIALFHDGAGQPIVGQPATLDIYKVTCSGETKRAIGTPMQGKTDNKGRFTASMVIGYNVHDAKDAVFIDASSTCGSVHKRFSPADLKAQASFPIWEPEIEVCSAAEAPLVVDSPTDGGKLVVDRTVQFRGTTGCKDATLTFVADGKHTFGTLKNVTGAFSYDYTFNSPGKNRTVAISVKDGQGCSGSRTLTLTVQPALGHTVETLTDSGNCAYELHSVNVPLAHPKLDVAGVGSASPKTVTDHAAANSQARAVINAGYFDSVIGPLSYARGHLGYESPVGNAKGPRSCLVIDSTTREARIELSMGRQPAGTTWGASLYPVTTDVVCAGPRLLESGANVAAAHVISEDFTSSGIKPTAAQPRTAACIRDDGALTLFVAQSPTVKDCGPDLVSLAGLLRGRGCVDALALDGGGSSALWFKGASKVYTPGTEDRKVYQGLLVHTVP